MPSECRFMERTPSVALSGGAPAAIVRTVASLGASAVSAHLDPAYRTGRLSLARLRRASLISAVVAAPLALVLAPVGYGMWQDSHWHPAADEPLETAAFSPHTGLMVTAFGGAIDGTDVLWDVTDLSRPKRLSQFEGGQPVALSPDGRTVATITYHGQAVLWNVTDPRHPVEMTTTVVVDREEMSANSGRDTIFDWPVTGSGTLGAGTVAARDVADFQPVIAPGDRTVVGSPPGSHG